MVVQSQSFSDFTGMLSISIYIDLILLGMLFHWLTHPFPVNIQGLIRILTSRSLSRPVWVRLGGMMAEPQWQGRGATQKPIFAENHETGQLFFSHQTCQKGYQLFFLYIFFKLPLMQNFKMPSVCYKFQLKFIYLDIDLQNKLITLSVNLTEIQNHTCQIRPSRNLM